MLQMRCNINPHWNFAGFARQNKGEEDPIFCLKQDVIFFLLFFLTKPALLNKYQAVSQNMFTNT
jgi:hypothetical protein